MTRPKVLIFNYFVNPKYNFTQNIVDWYQSMKKNYLTDCDRVFVIYTDNPDAKNAVKDETVQFIDVDASTTLNIKENIRAKFRYIQDYIDRFNPEFDYLSFIQSNARCVKPFELSSICDNDNLIVCKHIMAYYRDFMSLYKNVEGSVVDISNIDTSNFTYVHCCHFIVKKPMLLELCRYINSSIEADRKNGIYTSWQDENYFNYYLNTVLMTEPKNKIKVLDGRLYAHTYAKWARRANEGMKYDFVVEMLDKSKEYTNFEVDSINK